MSLNDRVSQEQPSLIQLKEGRIAREQSQIRSDEDGIAASTGGRIQIISPVDDIFYLEAALAGPEDSPYSEGIFTIQIKIPELYPFKPPTMNFKTRIWHPNVDFEDGEISLEIFKLDWSPAWTIQSIVLAIYSLMDKPVSSGPINTEAADQYESNRSLFVSIAQTWTRVFAGTTEGMTESRSGMIERFSQMGFCPVLAKSVLLRNDWNENRTVLELLRLQNNEIVVSADDDEAEAGGEDDDSTFYSRSTFGEESSLHDEDIPMDLVENDHRSHMIERLSQMGFERGLAERVLKSHDWVEDVAVAELLKVTSDTGDASEEICANGARVLVSDNAGGHAWTTEKQASSLHSKGEDGDDERGRHITLARISQMGFPFQLVESVLIRHNWDENAALVELFVLAGGSDDDTFSTDGNDECDGTWCVIQEDKTAEGVDSDEDANESGNWSLV